MFKTKPMKSLVFKLAWTFYRNHKNQEWGYCLKQAWKQVKTGIEYSKNLHNYTGEFELYFIKHKTDLIPVKYHIRPVGLDFICDWYKFRFTEQSIFGKMYDCGFEVPSTLIYN